MTGSGRELLIATKIVGETLSSFGLPLGMVFIPHPVMYERDIDGDGFVRASVPGEALFDPAMDGLNGNEITYEQFRVFRNAQQNNPMLFRILSRGTSMRGKSYRGAAVCIV